jgi:hypothetical protein
LCVLRYAPLILAWFVLTAARAQAPGGKQYQSKFCPKTAELEVSPSAKYWFEGYVGKKHVRMYLERGGAGVVGVVYDSADWVPLILGGRWTSGDLEAVEMTALSARDTTAAVVRGHVTAHGFDGMWVAGGEENGTAFQLKTATEPRCDGSGSWKAFQDGHWPVTFSYPASWHVRTSGDTVTLTCPDPALMAYDGYEINVMQGEDANNATTDFVQCGDKWIYGYECKCEDATRCKDAPAEEREGMTILRGEKREWRADCRGGGYVGEGQGDRRIVTFGDTWIVVEGQGPVAVLVEKIVGTAKKKGKP